MSGVNYEVECAACHLDMMDTCPRFSGFKRKEEESCACIRLSLGLLITGVEIIPALIIALNNLEVKEKFNLTAKIKQTDSKLVEEFKYRHKNQYRENLQTPGEANHDTVYF